MRLPVPPPAAHAVLTTLRLRYNIVKRAEIRERYGIESSGISDFCVSCCCLACAMVQQDREVALRAPHYGPVTKPYQGGKEAMHMPGAAAPR